MSAKKWLWCFLGTALLLALLLGAFNVLTDPFGVFGDPLLEWYSYNETNNPRAAKTTYLMEHLEDYDAYILGCSSTSSFPVEALNEAYDASFYNFIVYGADMLDTEQMAAWLLKEDEVKYIFLNVYLDNGMSYDSESNPYTDSMHPVMDGSSKLRFYSRFAFASPEYGIAKLRARAEDTWLQQSFDVFDELTGAYDKKKRDIEPIGDMESYLAAYPVFANYPKQGLGLPKIRECMESVARIRALCQEAGAELIVATAPVYGDYLSNFDPAVVTDFYTALAQVTDFWDFSYSSVSLEPRYFYDATHFRNAVGDMAVARMQGDTEAYVPEDFGHYVTAQNADAYFESYFDAAPAADLTAQVPILMYHHLSDTEENSATISPALFDAHMQALSAAGYNTVSFQELLSYVEEGTNLPEKPLVITFDDGYESNYIDAYPILQKYGMKATIFPIGVSIGKDTYKDTGESIHPHFNETQGKEMLSSGLIDLQSHTWDLHQSEALEEGPARTTASQLPGETEEEFIAALRGDFVQMAEAMEPLTGKAPYVLAYPQGVSSQLTEAIAREQGIQITLSTQPGTNTLVRGLPQSLFGLKRYGVDASFSPQGLIELLEQ